MTFDGGGPPAERVSSAALCLTCARAAPVPWQVGGGTSDDNAGAVRSSTLYCAHCAVLRPHLVHVGAGEPELTPRPAATELVRARLAMLTLLDVRVDVIEQAEPDEAPLAALYRFVDGTGFAAVFRWAAASEEECLDLVEQILGRVIDPGDPEEWIVRPDPPRPHALLLFTVRRHA